MATAAKANEKLAVAFDSSSAWLDAVEDTLAAHGIVTAGRSSDPEKALALVGQHRPDLLVADPAGDGIELLRNACTRAPALKAIALGELSEPEEVDEALSAGAAAFVVKRESSNAPGAAVREVLALARPLPYLDYESVAS